MLTAVRYYLPSCVAVARTAVDLRDVEDAFLGMNQDGHIRDVRRMSRAEVNAYIDAAGRLRVYERDQFPYACVVQGYAELQAAERHYAETDKSVQWSGSMEAGSRIALHFNRLIMNYLSAVRAFLDHSETRFKRAYGEQSKEFRALKDTMALHYDNSFSYPFVYELRNYAQHCGLPMGTFEASARESPRGSRNVVHEMTLCFLRDALLENYTKWKPSLKAQITAKPAQWDVLPDLQYMISAITDVHATILDQTIEAILPDARLVKSLGDEIVGEGVYKFVGRAARGDEKNEWRMTLNELPLYIAEMVFSDHRNLKD